MWGFKVRQKQDAHCGHGFESTDSLATGFLDEGHVGFVKAVPGGKDDRRIPSSLLSIFIQPFLWPMGENGISRE